MQIHVRRLGIAKLAFFVPYLRIHDRIRANTQTTTRNKQRAMHQAQRTTNDARRVTRNTLYTTRRRTDASTQTHIQTHINTQINTPIRKYTKNLHFSRLCAYCASLPFCCVFVSACLPSDLEIPAPRQELRGNARSLRPHVCIFLLRRQKNATSPKQEKRSILNYKRDEPRVG